MTRNNTQSFWKGPAYLARGLAMALLLCILLGAIGGAAHRHGNSIVPDNLNSDTSRNFNTDDGGTSSKQVPNGSDCLVCQLHRNLYAGLIGAAPHIGPQVAHLSFFEISQDTAFSLSLAPSRGRAPPTSLS